MSRKTGQDPTLVNSDTVVATGPPLPPALAGSTTIRDRGDRGDLAPGAMVGEYRIEKLLGSGGMGTVYAATHPVIGKKAAVKVIQPQLGASEETIERFVQEARAVNQIGHLNIVDIFSFGSLPDGRAYFVMEWLQGETLGERIKRGPMALWEAVPVLEQVCRALAAAHGKGIVHRDLKPDNIFLVVTPDGGPLVKLLDFGIAKLLVEDPGRTERTKTGVIIGTPLYLSPEQARGRAVDARTDIYSLGALAFEVLVGKPPFVADNTADILSMHLHEPPPLASKVQPEVPAGLAHLLVRMMAKSAGARPSLDVIREELAACRDPAGVIRAPRARRTWALVVSTLVVLAAAGVGVWRFAGPGSGSRSGSGSGGSGSEHGAASVPPPPAADAAPRIAVVQQPQPSPPPDAAPATPAAQPPRAATGTLVVRFVPPDATVRIDGDRMTPESRGLVRAAQLEPGSHVVEVSAPRRRTFVQSMVVKAGEQRELGVNLGPRLGGGGHGGHGGHGHGTPDDDSALDPYPKGTR